MAAADNLYRMLSRHQAESKIHGTDRYFDVDYLYFGKDVAACRVHNGQSNVDISLGYMREPSNSSGCLLATNILLLMHFRSLDILTTHIINASSSLMSTSYAAGISRQKFFSNSQTDTLNCATCQLVGSELRRWPMEGEISENLQMIP
jgi:hypothetical protein